MLGYEVQGMDPSIAAKMKALAPTAPVGSTEAKTAFAKATQGLDFDGSDGHADSFNGKSLSLNDGGRAQYLKAKLRVAGTPEADINNIVGGHFTNVVKSWAAGQPDMNAAPMAKKVQAWRDAHGDTDGSAAKLATKVSTASAPTGAKAAMTGASTSSQSTTANPFTG